VTAVVGFIGLGVMGSAMAHHLLASGVQVLGVDIDERRIEAFRHDGGEAADLDALAGRADVIVTSLPSAIAARQVLGATSPLYTPALREAIIIETSTLALSIKRDLQAQSALHGVTLLDCPMSGTGHQAMNADLVAYLSGDVEEAKARVRPVLECFTRDVHDVGLFGAGTSTKLVANLLVAIHNCAAAEAMLLAQTLGLEPQATMRAVSDGAGQSRMFDVRAPLMVDQRYEPASMRVSLFMKDIALIADLQARLGNFSPLFQATQAIYEEVMEQGMGEWDTACVYDLLKLRGKGR